MNKKTLLHDITSCGNDAKTLAGNFEQIALIHQCGAPMDASQTHIHADVNIKPCVKGGEPMIETDVLYPQFHKPDWCESFSGHKFYPADPAQSDILIGDIAHALSFCCRFAGHCSHYYSVAHHSILVHRLVSCHEASRETLKYALLHDAAEAYIHDITRPLKVSSYMQDYKRLQDKWDIEIAKAFGINMDEVDFQLVKEADNHALKLEAAALMHGKGLDWSIPETREFIDPVAPSINWFECIEELSPERAKDEFKQVWVQIN